MTEKLNRTMGIELRLLAVTVDAMTASDIVELLNREILTGRLFVMANHNLHSLYLAQTDDEFRRFYDSVDTTVIDGFPVLVMARRELKRSGITRELDGTYRVGSVDWIERLSEVSGLSRIAVVGASEVSNRGACAALAAKVPGIETLSLPGAGWTEDRAREVVEALQAFRPDLVVVGLGMPLQEHFLSVNRAALPPAVYATVGGAIDQISGVQPMAPRWIGKFGVEWLWRLVRQPRRLAHRYLVEPIKLAAVLVRKRQSAEARDV